MSRFQALYKLRAERRQMFAVLMLRAKWRRQKTAEPRSLELESFYQDLVTSCENCFKYGNENETIVYSLSVLRAVRHFNEPLRSVLAPTFSQPSKESIQYISSGVSESLATPGKGLEKIKLRECWLHCPLPSRGLIHTWFPVQFRKGWKRCPDWKVPHIFFSFRSFKTSSVR